MKVSELNDYREFREKPEKTGIRVWDRVSHRATHAEFIITYASTISFVAINTLTGAGTYRGAFKVDASAMNRNFTKSELEQILGDLDNWEVVE